MPTLSQALEQLQYKIRRFGPNAHCTEIIVSEESRARAIENKPDERGKQRTRIGLETYSPESYSAWNQAIEYLMERCGYNPLIVVDLLLLLVQEARQQTEGPDGIEIAKSTLFNLRDYPAELHKAKEEWKAKRKRAKG